MILKRMVFFLIVLVVLGATGCSRKASDGRASIEFWTYSAGGSKDKTAAFWNEVARRFEAANPGVRVNVVADIPHGYYMSMLGTRFIGRNPPDVMIMDDVDLGDLAHEGMLLPLEEFMKQDPVYKSGDYAPSMVRDSYVEGIRYSAPWYGSFVQVTYRTDLFAKAGVRPPKTWDELLAVCRTLQRELGMRYPFAMSLRGSFWMINWVWQNGGSVVSLDYRRVTIDSPQAIEAIQFVHDLMYKYRVMNPDLARGTKMRDLWSQGKIAMMMDGAFSVGRYDELYPQWKGRWELSPLPAGKKRVSFYGGAHLVVSRHTKHPKLAWRFIVFATRPEIQMLFSDMTGNPPANMKVFDLPEFQKKHPHLARMRKTINYGRNNPLAPFFPKIWYEIFRNKVLDLVMDDPNADIASAVHQAARDMQRVVDDYWETHPYFTKAGKRKGGH